MSILKQSTAATIKLGPFVDDTDGKTAETALTIGQADIRLSKNGGDIAQSHNTAGATHDELGYYDIPLDTTDTGTLGRLRVLVSKSGALPVWQDFVVVTANVYDTLCSTDTFDVNVTSLADDVITAGKFDESTAYPLKSADTGATAVARVGADSDTLETLSDEIAAVKAETAAILVDTGTDGVVLKAAGLSADAVAEIADGVWDEAISGHTTATTFGGKNQKVVPSETIGDYKADVSGVPAAVWGYATRTLSSFGSLIADIWSHVTRTLSSFGFTVATNSDANVTAIKAKTDNLPANTATALAAIQSDLDNPTQYKADVSGLATQASVNAIPTTPLLAANYTAPDNASIAAILEDTGTTIPATLAGLATSTEVGAIALLGETVVGSYTVQDILKILAAKMVGKATGGGTATITYRGVDDTSDVIVETVDSNGNRSAVTLTV